MIKRLLKEILALEELGDVMIAATLRSARLAIERQPLASVVGLLCGWTALFAALWVAMISAVIGAIGGFFDIGLLSFGVGQASQGFVLAGAAAGFAAGFVHGFLWIYGGSISAAPSHVLISLVAGLLLAFAITGFCFVFESVLLDFRSYRRPSRRVKEGSLQPLLKEVGERMGLRFVPRLRIADTPGPGVWTYLRHIVLSKGLIDQLDEEELAAVMAHELHHLYSGDILAMRFVWACTFPLVALVNLYAFIFTRVQSVQRFATFAWVLVWPAYTLLHLVVAPLMIARGRRQEYEADAGAIAAGYGTALGRALAKTQEFEISRSGWEAALLRSHPPLEFRLEAIEEAAEPARKPAASSKRARAANHGARATA